MRFSFPPLLAGRTNIPGRFGTSGWKMLIYAAKIPALFPDYPEFFKVSDIFLKNCRIRFEKNGTQSAGVFDEMPSVRNRFPHDAPAFFLENVRKLVMKNCSVTYSQKRDSHWRSEFEIINSKDLQIDCQGMTTPTTDA